MIYRYFRIKKGSKAWKLAEAEEKANASVRADCTSFCLDLFGTSKFFTSTSWARSTRFHGVREPTRNLDILRQDKRQKDMMVPVLKIRAGKAAAVKFDEFAKATSKLHKPLDEHLNVGEVMEACKIAWPSLQILDGIYHVRIPLLDDTTKHRWQKPPSDLIEMTEHQYCQAIDAHNAKIKDDDE